MTQTLYAHMNKIKIKKNYLIQNATGAEVEEPCPRVFKHFLVQNFLFLHTKSFVSNRFGFS
jgi:hypothetical protein